MSLNPLRIALSLSMAAIALVLVAWGGFAMVEAYRAGLPAAQANLAVLPTILGLVFLAGAASVECSRRDILECEAAFAAWKASRILARD